MKDLFDIVLDLHAKLHTLENHRGLNKEIRAFINEQMLTRELEERVQLIKECMDLNKLSQILSKQ